MTKAILLTVSLFVLSLLFSSGCSTALSTVQPADTLAPGSFHVSGGIDFSLPTSRIADLTDQVDVIGDKYKADPNYQPTEDEQLQFFDTAIGLALNAPGPATDFMIRYGICNRFDAGLRWTTTGVHVDGKFQFMKDAAGWDGSLSVGVASHFFKGLVFDLLEYMEIDEFSRWDVELPLIFGRKFGDWAYVWGGPKYVFARYSLDGKIKNLEEKESSDDVIHYFGGFAGFGVGYRWVHVFFELSVMNMIAKPQILGREIDIGGLIVIPAGGLMVRW